VKFARLTDTEGRACYVSEFLLVRSVISGEASRTARTIVTSNVRVALRDAPEDVVRALESLSDEGPAT